MNFRAGWVAKGLAPSMLSVLLLHCAPARESSNADEAALSPPPADGSGEGYAGEAGVALQQDPLSTVAGSQDEHEPSIAVSPTGHVAVSFLSYSSPDRSTITVGYRISNDFGATWAPATLVPIPAGDNTQANASVAADSQGNLYMAWAAESHTQQGRENLHIFVAKAGPTDTQFGAPVDVQDPSATDVSYDLPRVTVTAAGTVIVTYAQFGNDATAANPIMASTTADFQTWTHSTVVGPGSAGSFRNFARLCQARAGGPLYMAYVDSDLAATTLGYGVGLLSSADDGATWSPPTAVQLPEEEVEIGFYGTDCVTNGGDVWVYYTLSPAANLGNFQDLEFPLTRLLLTHSSDYGQTFDRRQDVGDANALFMDVSIVAEETSGLDIAFFSGQAPGGPAQFRRSRAADGQTFLPSAAVLTGATLDTDRTISTWLGDYSGRAFEGGNLFLVYADNANQTAHIGFFRTPVAAPLGPSDAGLASSDSEVPSFDAGIPTCFANSPFVLPAWAPPAPFAQKACSADQIASYLACNPTGSGGDCSAFRGAADNAACVACIETDVGAPLHGPVMTQTLGGVVQILGANGGGCLANFDGQTDAASCGAETNANVACFTAQCSSCSDFASQTGTGPTEPCAYASMLPGAPCENAQQTNACAGEEVEGGVGASCATFSTFLPLWCGG